MKVFALLARMVAVDVAAASGGRGQAGPKALL